MIDTGIFTLKTPAQLFEKLRRDHERVKKAPLDSDAWFNFVVTADHLPEWEFAADAQAASELREQDPILRICHHLSRNAKHFTAEDNRRRKGTLLLNPVAQTTEVRTVTFGETPAANARPETSGRVQEFALQLSAREAQELGTSQISALELAERVVEFWQVRLKVPAAEKGTAAEKRTRIIDP